MAQKRKKQKKWISWVVLLVLFLVAGAIVYLVWDSYFKDKDDGVDEPKTEQVEKFDKNDDVKEEEVEVVEKQKIEQYEGNDPNNAETISGVMTYVGVSGDKLMIRVNIDQYLNGGNCELSIERNGVVLYSEVASVMGSASTATCEGFDVPISELGNGDVDIVINVQSGDKNGTISGEASL